MRVRARAAAVWAFLLTACAGTPEVDPSYRPAENVLEVVAVLRRHVPDDTYRFPPARDFTDRNVYRSSLLRLENIERVHARDLRAGHMDGVIAFAKGRALERLRAFDLAGEQYHLAAEREETLSSEALRSAEVCEGLQEASALGLDLDAAALEGEGLEGEGGDVETVLDGFDRRSARLEELLAAVGGTHHVAVAREEIERADVARAHYFVGLRKALPEGDVRAVSELERLALTHRESKNASRHMLALGTLYEELAREYAARNPPESLYFDPVRFQELVDSGARLYEMVTYRDGTPEKIEASRRLEAFLAFALRIDRDRFTP
jgi:hypothetical protein